MATAMTLLTSREKAAVTRMATVTVMGTAIAMARAMSQRQRHWQGQWVNGNCKGKGEGY